MSLHLLHQALERLKISDAVYLAIPQVKGRKTLARHVALCRRLGLGLLTVRLSDGFVEAQCDPRPYAPRKVKARQSRLLREFQRRDGDPKPWRSRGQDRHCLPPGCAALRGASGRTRTLPGCGGQGRHRRRPRHYADARQPLWLVREGGKGDLPNHREGTGGDVLGRGPSGFAAGRSICPGRLSERFAGQAKIFARALIDSLAGLAYLRSV